MASRGVVEEEKMEDLLQLEDIEKLRQDTYREIRKNNTIDYIESEISYEEFYRRYLLPNRPCVLGAWATQSWRSVREWVTPALTPHLDYLNSMFGEAEVPVANCEVEQYSSHPKQDMKLSDYTHYLSHTSRAKTLYLKDWHFVSKFPSYHAYKTPVYFRSDWLNEYWDSLGPDHDDYRFVYMGPKGSWTPFHADVLRSYSWSANVCGLKRWWFYAPGEEECVKDRYGQLAYDLRSPELEDVRHYPQYEGSKPWIEVLQRRGEVIFVPSGWHHQVFNLEDTISINHNWLNACSIDVTWAFIRSSLSDVKREISDCRDMDGWGQQCQLILKASSGIDYIEFYKFLYTIALPRLNFLQKHKDDLKSPDHHDECNDSAESGFVPCNENTELAESAFIPCDKSNDSAESAFIHRDENNDSAESTNNQGTASDGSKGGTVFDPVLQPHSGDYCICDGCHGKVSSDSNCDIFMCKHYRFDLLRIMHVLKGMMMDEDFSELDFSVLPEEPVQLLNRIESVL